MLLLVAVKRAGGDLGVGGRTFWRRSQLSKWVDIGSNLSRRSRDWTPFRVAAWMPRDVYMSAVSAI